MHPTKSTTFQLKQKTKMIRKEPWEWRDITFGAVATAYHHQLLPVQREKFPMIDTHLIIRSTISLSFSFDFEFLFFFQNVNNQSMNE